MDPKSVGADGSAIVLTARSGRHALLYKLRSLGHEVNKEDVDDLYHRFLELADREKQVPDEALKDLITTIS